MPGQGAADFVDASLDLSDVSSVDVPENGSKESCDGTDGSDEIHDLHRDVTMLSHGLGEEPAYRMLPDLPILRTILPEFLPMVRPTAPLAPPLRAGDSSSSGSARRPVGTEPRRGRRARGDQAFETVEPEAGRDSGIQRGPRRCLRLEVLEQAGTQEDPGSLRRGWGPVDRPAGRRAKPRRPTPCKTASRCCRADCAETTGRPVSIRTERGSRGPRIRRRCRRCRRRRRIRGRRSTVRTA